MTNLDLISAIGEAVKQEDLEHSERLVTHRRRVSTRVLLAAALIALLSFTAYAAPAIYNALFGVKTTQSAVSRIFVEKGKPADVHESALDITLEVRMLPEAPSEIETFWAPMLPAKQWDPIPLQKTEGSVVNFDLGVLLQWQNADGEYVKFEQTAWPYDTVGEFQDTLLTGFDASYSVSQTELGGYRVQRIIVEPSEKEENGVYAAHPGLQKLYWSDGLYIFSMEANYSMPDARLAEILESIRPVSDPAHYLVIEEIPVPETEPKSSLDLDRILFPGSLPQGYVQAYGRRYEDGECFFLWRKEGVNHPTVLELTIAPQGRNDLIKKEWETQAKPCEKTERDVNGTLVLCFQDSWTAQLLWQLDGADYMICSAGPERLTAEELLELLEGMTFLEDVDSVLMRKAAR